LISDFLDLRFIVILVACISCTKGDESPKAVIDVSRPEMVAGLEAAENEWRSYRLLSAIDKYLALDLSHDGELLQHRGDLLLSAGDFYCALGEFSAQLRTELLRRWMAERRDGQLESVLLPAVAALDAAHGHRWQECLRSLGEADIDALPSWLAARALMAGAMAANSVEDMAQHRRLRRALLALDVAGDADVTLAEAANLKTTTDDTLSVALHGLSAERQNPTYVDLAVLNVRAGRYDAAYAALREYDATRPLVSESIRNGTKRRFHAIEFLPVLSTLCYRLALRDLERAERLAPGSVGLLLGTVRLRLGDATAAAEILQATWLDPERGEFDRGMAEARHAAALTMWSRDREGRDRHVRDIDLAQGLAGASRQACLAGEVARQGAVDEALALARRALDTVVLATPTTDDGNLHRYYAALWSAAVLRLGGSDDRDRALEAIRVAHDPGAGYDPSELPPEHLLELARVYRANHNTMAESIVGGMVAHFDEVRPVHGILQYLNSNSERLPPGEVAPGHGANN
jgi:tetratricopeptide (TPR) repeat protein